MLQEFWCGFKGLAKKATIVYSALTAISAIALQALLLGDTNSMRRVNLYRN